jgi:glycosyltransferase involved in cell wall biosynthesis
VSTYTIVIPVHNGEVTLERAVHSGLNQTLPPAKVIISDNSSTDSTLIVAKGIAKLNPKVEVRSNSEFVEPQASFRRSLEGVNGRFMWLAADDELAPSAARTLYSQRCGLDCEHPVTHRPMFIEGTNEIILGKDFAGYSLSKNPQMSFLKFPADNPLIYGLLDAEAARKNIPKSSCFAWDWVFAFGLIRDGFHHFGEYPVVIREWTPTKRHQSVVRKQDLWLDRVLPLRKASTMILRKSRIRDLRTVLVRLTLLNGYIFLHFGTFSNSRFAQGRRGARSNVSTAQPTRRPYFLAINDHKYIKMLGLKVVSALPSKIRQKLFLRVANSRAEYFGTVEASEDHLLVSNWKIVKNESQSSGMLVREIPPLYTPPSVVEIEFEVESGLNRLLAQVAELSLGWNCKVIVHSKPLPKWLSEILLAILHRDPRLSYQVMLNTSKIKRSEDQPKILEKRWLAEYKRFGYSSVARTKTKSTSSLKLHFYLPEVPQAGRDSGSKDALLLISLLCAMGHKVTVIVPHMHSSSPISVKLLQNLVKVTTPDSISEQAHGAIIFGPYAFDFYRTLSRPEKFIYVMVDAVFRRQQQDMKLISHLEKIAIVSERSAILAAESTLAISEKDLSLVQARYPGSNVEYFPLLRIAPSNLRSRDLVRDSFIFIGSLGHGPNKQAAEWIVDDLGPELAARGVENPIILVGGGTESLKPKSDNVICLGRVNILNRLYGSAIASLAPMRTVAGINGKIVESVSYGVPALVSPESAENLPTSLLRVCHVLEGVDEYVAAMSLESLRLDRPRKSDIDAAMREFNGDLNAKVLKRLLRNFR